LTTNFVLVHLAIPAIPDVIDLLYLLSSRSLDFNIEDTWIIGLVSLKFWHVHDLLLCFLFPTIFPTSRLLPTVFPTPILIIQVKTEKSR